METKSNFFCKATLNLIAKDEKSKLWLRIQDWSIPPFHFNRSIIRRTLCIPSECSDYRAKKRYSEYRANRELEAYNLKAELFRVDCREEKIDYWGSDLRLLGVGVVLYICLLLFATMFDQMFGIHSRSKASEWLLSFSITSNYKKITSNKNEDFQRLKCIQGIRTYQTVLVILMHTMLALGQMPISNTFFVEQILSNYAIRFVVTFAMFIIQTYFVISSWLLTNQVLGMYKKNGRFSLRDALLLFLHRISRFWPPLLTMIFIQNLLFIKFANGPSNFIITNIFSQSCKRNWWATVLQVSNLLDMNEVCNVSMWSLTIDTQCYIINIILFYVILNYQVDLKKCLGAVFAAFYLIRVFVPFQNELPLVRIVDLKILEMIIFLSDESLAVSYVGFWINFGSSLVGVLFGYFYFLSKDDAEIKPVEKLCGPLFVALPVTAVFIATLKLNKFVTVIVGPLLKPLYGFGIACGIYGMSRNIIRGWTKKICENEAAVWLANFTFSTYIYHFLIVFSRDAWNTSLVELSVLNVTVSQDRGDIEICETSQQTPNTTDAISDIDSPEETLSFAESQNVSTTESKSTTDENVNDDQALSSTKIADAISDINSPEETLSFAESQNVSTTESKSTTDENVNDDQALSSTKIADEYPVDNDPITEPGSEYDHGASSSDNYDPENESSSSSSSCSTCSSSSSSSEDSSQETSKLPLKRRKKNIGTWKKNIRKQKRLRGEAYISVKNIEKPARPLLPPPCAAKPKHKCLQSVSEENRSKIYVEFRQLSALDDQRSFIVHHVEQIPKKRITRNLENSRRVNTCNYFLTVDGQKMKVCREFFMSTLNVTDSFIRISLQKRSSTGIVEKDRRGKHTPANKLTDDCLQIIRDHILTFPAVESHYCRSSSKKKYLDPTLNLSIMHNMYKSLCEEKNIPPVSIEKYRQVFKEYNVGFFKPKKDQCKICLAQKNMTGEEKEAQEETFQQHLKRKESARKTRNEDKLEAKDNSTLLAFNFDLEAVLTTPKGSAGQIFYLRKLAVYNLTIYNIGNQDGICYLWDETQGKRGSNEIASCIYEYVLSNTEIKEVRMMSDGCGGQQKNSNFAAMCMHLISVHPSLKIIDHKFFETGHTEMECDSIHSKIEQKAKHVPVYIPEGWAQVIRDARMKPRPFEVKSRSFDDFYDFKEYAAQNFDMSKIPWRKICWIRYLKSVKTEVFYKIGFDQEFQEVNCKKKFRGRPKTVELKKAYECELPIAKPKYLDLQKMCSDLTIPKIHHRFYKSLNYNDKIRDRLPEPDESENTDTDEN